jgi:hypothetical protein
MLVTNTVVTVSFFIKTSAVVGVDVVVAAVVGVDVVTVVAVEAVVVAAVVGVAVVASFLLLTLFHASHGNLKTAGNDFCRIFGSRIVVTTTVSTWTIWNHRVDTGDRPAGDTSENKLSAL